MFLKSILTLVLLFNSNSFSSSEMEKMEKEHPCMCYIISRITHVAAPIYKRKLAKECPECDNLMQKMADTLKNKELSKEEKERFLAQQSEEISSLCVATMKTYFPFKYFLKHNPERCSQLTEAIIEKIKKDTLKELSESNAKKSADKQN